jgi:hypothetical protein
MWEKTSKPPAAQAAFVLILIAAATSAQEKISCSLKFEKGRKYHVHTQVSTHTMWKEGGNEQTLDSRTSYGFGVEVAEIDPDGGAWLNWVFELIRIDSAGPERRISYDSSMEDIPVPPGAQVYAWLPGERFYVKMTPLGRVDRINGIDMIHTRVRGKAPAGQARAAVSSTLRMEFGEQAIRELIEGFTAVYPTEPVAVGDTWKQEGGKDRSGITIEKNCRLSERKEGLAVIEIDTTIKSNPALTRRRLAGVMTEYDITGTQQTTARIREADGLIVETKLTRQTTERFETGASGKRPKGLPELITRQLEASMRMTDRK